LTAEPSLRLPAGYRVLVTAGASEAGRAIALALLRAGAKVHVCDVDEAALAALAEQHLNASVTVCDLAVDQQVERLFQDVEATLGGLDALVNTSGIGDPAGAIESIAPAAWRRWLDVGMTGMFLVTRKAVPLLKRNPDGCIVNVIPVAGRPGDAASTPGAVAREGMVGFTRSLARELGPAGIRVNAILPNVALDGAADADDAAADAERRYLGRPAPGRMVSGGDVAGMVLFLCSSLGRTMSGQSLGMGGHVESL
jgi:NAD(P)-dependent dehydrogenase (short-subunit alcohol dehydrogenase family)